MASSRARYERIAMDSRGQLRDAWNRFVKGFQVVDEYKSNIVETDRLVSRTELKALLQNNVCEIVFVRRRPERAPVPPRVEIRRMICTNSLKLLTSYNIFIKDYRNVSI